MFVVVNHGWTKRWLEPCLFGMVANVAVVTSPQLDVAWCSAVVVLVVVVM